MGGGRSEGGRWFLSWCQSCGLVWDVLDVLDVFLNVLFH